MANNLTYIPEPPDKYKGKQALINSDRVLLNARNDAILMFASKAIGFSSAGTLNFDSDKTCIINSPKIQLGLNAVEPILLGNKTVDLLKELLQKLNILADSLGKVSVYIGDAQYPLTEVNTPAQDLKISIDNLLSSIENIKSKQSFTL